ncbi:MAG: hypothetical protein ABI024_00940 [Vicinamibacterales bacterium]
MNRSEGPNPINPATSQSVKRNTPSPIADVDGNDNTRHVSLSATQAAAMKTTARTAEWKFAARPPSSPKATSARRSGDWA